MDQSKYEKILLGGMTSFAENLFDLASDQINGLIQSQRGVDLASFNGFQLNNQTGEVNTLAIEDGDFEGNFKMTSAFCFCASHGEPSIARYISPPQGE